MSTLTAEPVATMAELLQRLGVSARRIRMQPPPGTAVVGDVLEVRRRTGLWCELVERTLIEKSTMGYSESLLAAAIIEILRRFVVPRNLGLVSGEQGTMQLAPGLVRIPDVAFAPWSRIPGGTIPREAIPQVVPALVVEVVSLSNTADELQRKRSDYFSAGVDIVWIVDIELRCVEVHHPAGFETLRASDRLQGEAVLPGFELPLAELFAELDRKAGASST